MSDNPEVALRPLILQVGREIAHLDFKTLRTLRALLDPGRLTQEFLAGRRQRFLSPLKVYFLCAAIFFFAFPFVGFGLPEWLERDGSGTLRSLVAPRLQAREMDLRLFSERFDNRFQTVYTLSLSISILVVALLLRALYRRDSLGAHLVFALHYVSFIYLASIALLALLQVSDVQHPVASLGLLYVVLLPYLYLALLRLYRERPLRTMFNVLVLVAVSFVVDNAVNIGALLLTLRLV